MGESTDVDSLMTMVRKYHLDLVLLEWELTKRRSTEILMAARKLLPEIKIIALSGNPEVSSLALIASADAFVCKCDPVDRFLATMSASA